MTPRDGATLDAINPATPDVIEFAGVGADAAGLYSVEGGRVSVTVRREQVEHAAARFGSQSLHPLAQTLLAIALCLIGLLAVPVLFTWAVRDRVVFILPVFMLVFLLIGPWLLYDALRRGYYLEVRSPAGRKKLAFDRKATAADIESFLKSVEKRFGYKIDRDFGRLG